MKINREQILFQYTLRDDLAMRPLTRDDLKYSNYKSWFYNYNVFKFTSHGNFNFLENDIDDFFKLIYSKKIIVWAIYHLNKESKDCFHIGNISLQSIDWINKSAELAIIIGESDFWGNGIGFLASWQVLFHGFYRLGLNRIWSGTSEYNTGMIKIFNKLKMRKEGEWIDAKYLNGKYTNIVQHAILQKEFIEEYIEVN